MRVHICFGEPDKDFEKLKADALNSTGGVFDWWNISKSARPGDRVIFYMVAPISAFVASAEVDSVVECPEKESKWRDKPCAWLREAKMLPRQVTLTEAKQRLPEWRYLKRLTAACIPNKNTPTEVADEFLKLLQVDEPLTFDYQKKPNSTENQYTTKATADDFLKAFSNKTLLNELETTQLQLHFQQPAHAVTPTFLGKLMGEKSHQGVSSRNVWMAKKISKYLDIEPPQREDGTARWWAYLVNAEKTGRYWQLQLKPEVVSALTQLGWLQQSIVPEEELKAELQEEIANSRADSPENRKKRLELAPKKPTIVQVTRAEYRRNSDVVAELMLRASGICEGCGCNAPFIRASDGTPYLEVHHVLPLAEGGDDTVENAIALCPNCHRRKHFGKDDDQPAATAVSVNAPPLAP